MITIPEPRLEPPDPVLPCDEWVVKDGRFAGFAPGPR
jgi:hypothetical protein